jgi:uncharacterized protein
LFGLSSRIRDSKKGDNGIDPRVRFRRLLTPRAQRAIVQGVLPPDVSAAIERLAALLRERFGERVREYTLFGSRARGNARADSDVDLLVVVDGLSEMERGEVFDLAWAAGVAGMEGDGEYIVLAPLPYSTGQAAEQRQRERRLMREVDERGVPLWSHSTLPVLAQPQPLRSQGS